jgi:hypothetical protein
VILDYPLFMELMIGAMLVLKFRIKHLQNVAIP